MIKDIEGGKYCPMFYGTPQTQRLFNANTRTTQEECVNITQQVSAFGLTGFYFDIYKQVTQMQI